MRYIKAGLLDNNKLIKAKIRYRGDTIPHWGNEKKSIRVKTSKGQLYQGMRVFNLLAPKFAWQLNNYFSYQLAKRLGLISPKTKLVRVILNNEDRGVHILVEQLREITLRRHHLMPADIYQGEIIGKDKHTDSHISHLFDVSLK
ncbi:MAG: CotH kinase family protein [Candidatus Methanofishera endochildressiae]|uniref:CotH kinase family protein n=1 Tax=Candidatus Methanofishera endochildressiae TaxID=2738884 RepID=A0A7Z0MPU3_9GAMM|nr:CotH kinase family protein [Candidatus Methanofishera endochildressiae]